ncbi:MAG: PaaI family thioesterase [Candidatus Omnitrophica bacterium]|nr:PaaI family thioesterase [Candidatus Omnitrophota bacterium]
MSKLIERIRAIQRGELPAPPVAKLLDMRITQVGEGRVTMQMPVDKRYANPIGTLHGGIICDLADAAMGTAFATTCEEEESYVTVELKCNYLRPVWDTVLTALAWVVSRGRTVGLVECEVKDKDDRLIAKLSSTLMVLRGDAAKGREIK